MYNSLTVKNIKTFKEKQTLRIAPLTLLYGENSSGKTTLLKTFDIIHNIFEGGKIRGGKLITNKKSAGMFRGNSSIQNISANKVHFFSSGINKRPIEIEIDLNIPFADKPLELLKYYKTPYKALLSGNLVGNSYLAPVKLTLELKYFPKNKITRVNSISIKRNDGLLLMKFLRINKNYENLNKDDIGYQSPDSIKWLSGKEARRGIFFQKRSEDYFLSDKFYADYKFKVYNEKVIWENQYNLFIKNFSEDKKIFKRLKLSRFIIDYLFYLKWTVKLNKKDYAAVAYSSIKKMMNVVQQKGLSHLSKKDYEISKVKILKTILSKRELYKDLKRLQQFYSKNQKLKKFEKEFCQKFLFIDNIVNSDHTNLILLKSMINIKDPKKDFPFSKFCKFAKEDQEKFYTFRFFTFASKKLVGQQISGGNISYSTFDFLHYFSKFISNGLEGCFWDEKNFYKSHIQRKNSLPRLNRESLVSNLLPKCINQIGRTIEQLIVCRPSDTDVSYSVPNESDLPDDFYGQKYNYAKTYKHRYLGSDTLDKRLQRAGAGVDLGSLYGDLHALPPDPEVRFRKFNDAHRISANGFNFDRIIIDNNKLRKDLNKILKDLLNLEVIIVTPKFLKNIIKNKDLYQKYKATRMLGMGLRDKQKFIMLRDLKFKKTFPIHGEEIGKGPSNILPFLAQMLSDRPDVTYLVQELENNWHPKYQSKIIKLIIENIKNSKENKTYILETHSELFVLQVKKLVQQGLISHKDVSINFIKRLDNGQSTIINLPLNDLGGFEKEWPGGFFSERMEILTS